MRYIESGEYYCELLSLETQDALVSLRQSPGLLVEGEGNANVLSEVDKLGIQVIPDDGDVWDLEGTGELVEVERIVVEGSFRDVLESRRMTCAEAMCDSVAGNGSCYDVRMVQQPFLAT